MFSFFWFVVAAAVVCAGIIAFVRWGMGKLPLWVCGSVCIGGMALMGGITVPYLIGGKGGSIEFVIAIGLLIGTMGTLAYQIAQIIGGFGANALYGSSLRNDGTTYSTTAERLANRGEIDEAIAEYRLYMLENATNPTPLFSAAGLAEEHDRHIAALECYAEIRERFESDVDVWASAALREANLRRTKLDDIEVAQSLYEEILERAPESNAAKHVMKLQAATS